MACSSVMIAGLEIEVRVGSAISLLLSLLAGVTLAAVPNE